MKKAVVVGGGIVGLATALKLLEMNCGYSVIVLEKDAEVASQQTGHNSGVIHAGVYYKANSLKAKNSRRGVDLLLAFCQKQNIPFELCGKVVVATTKEELPLLDELMVRSRNNGVPSLRKISREELKEIEPHAEGLAALHSPRTGIIDYKQVAVGYKKEIERLGGEVHLSEAVIGIRKVGLNRQVITTKDTYEADLVITCAGLHADRVAHMSDSKISKKQIIPFRGEYYMLKPDRRSLVKGLIYPVADPRFPFLGVHLTKMIDGEVEAGPNAVLALSREGYTKWDINACDCKDLLTYSGFWNLAKKHWKMGVYEYYRSFSKKAFTKSLQKLVPELKDEDLVPAGAGVRAQVVLTDGTLQYDFQIERDEGLINVLNAPSPAATQSLAIAEEIISRIA